MLNGREPAALSIADGDLTDSAALYVADVDLAEKPIDDKDCGVYCEDCGMGVCSQYTQCDVLTDHLMSKKHRKTFDGVKSKASVRLEKFFTLFGLRWRRMFIHWCFK